MTPKALVKNYCWYWRLKYGSPYSVAWTKHQGIFKRLLGVYEARTLSDYIAFYLTHFVDRYSDERGHPIELFQSLLPAIISQFNKHKAQQTRSKSTNDYERILEARKRSEEE